MATSASAYLSNAASASYVNPTIWAEAIEQVARQENVMEKLGVVDNRALGTSGVQINIAKNQAFVAAALTEGVATPVTTLAFGQVTVTFSEVGLAKQVSMLEIEYGLKAVFNDIVMNMGEAMATYKDKLIASTLGTGGKNTIYAGGVTSGAVSSANVFSTTLIANGITKMRTENRKPISLVIHPNCENKLLVDSQFVNAATYGGREVIMSGEIGRYLGVTVYSTNNISSATENATTVYQNLLLGDRAFVVAYKRKPRIQWKEDSILDRAITFAADEAYGVSVLNSEAIVVLKSA